MRTSWTCLGAILHETLLVEQLVAHGAFHNGGKIELKDWFIVFTIGRADCLGIIDAVTTMCCYMLAKFT